MYSTELWGRKLKQTIARDFFLQQNMIGFDRNNTASTVDKGSILKNLDDLKNNMSFDDDYSDSSDVSDEETTDSEFKKEEENAKESVYGLRDSYESINSPWT